jgi:hypothetical protein
MCGVIHSRVVDRGLRREGRGGEQGQCEWEGDGAHGLCGSGERDDVSTSVSDDAEYARSEDGTLEPGFHRAWRCER